MSSIRVVSRAVINGKEVSNCITDSDIESTPVAGPALRKIVDGLSDLVAILAAVLVYLVFVLPAVLILALTDRTSQFRIALKEDFESLSLNQWMLLVGTGVSIGLWLFIAYETFNYERWFGPIFRYNLERFIW